MRLASKRRSAVRLLTPAGGQMLFGQMTLTLLWCQGSARAGKVLMMPNPFVVSHQRLFYKLADELVDAGHDMTILRWARDNGSALGALPPPTRCTLINLSGTAAHLHNQLWIQETIDSILWKEKDRYKDYVAFMNSGRKFVVRPCLELELEEKLMGRLVKEAFQLAIIDPHAYPCAWMLANALRLPYVTLTPSIPVYYVDKASSTPTPFSYVASINDALTDRMSWLERAKNTLDQLFFSSSLYFLTLARLIAVRSRRFTDSRHDPLFVLFLDNNKVAAARPYSNTHISVGLKPRATLPLNDELSSFTGDFTSNGTIIFSLTTLGKKERMSTKMRQTFHDAFKHFRNYRIIWRTSIQPNSRSGSEGHIHYTNWFNQTNLFGDPKTKLLITHAGISSVLEAVRHGVPMLAMPLGLDHYGNAARISHRGIGLQLHKHELSVVRLRDAITQLITNRKYQTRASELAEMLEWEAALLDNPMLWWTEYALRHGHKLKRRKAYGESLSLSAYFLLDQLVLLLHFVAGLFLLLRFN